MELLVKFGNHKIGDDTLIINMGTATDCPSKKLNLCQVCNDGIKCYAFKAEQQYKEAVLNYRQKQHDYWKNTPATGIVVDLVNKISRRQKKIKYMRFNESGDFHDQSDIDKLSHVAEHLKHHYKIITYGYSARSDLDFTNATFLLKGSNHNNGNNGMCVVVNNKDQIPDGYIECPGGKKGCKTCSLCKSDSKINIAFIKH